MKRLTATLCLTLAVLFGSVGRSLVRYVSILAVFFAFFPFSVQAQIGDTYFCDDIRFTTYKGGKTENQPNYKFFLRWSDNFIQVKFVGENSWRDKQRIVFQNKYSFLSWEIDPVDGSGISTSSLDEFNSDNILFVRSHNDKGFVSSAFSKCFRQ